VIVAFITDHKDRFGVEPICTVLSGHGCKIAPSTFYDNLNRQPSKQELRNTDLIAAIEQAREKRFVKLLGARKMWLHLPRAGTRCRPVHRGAADDPDGHQRRSPRQDATNHDRQ
jgi:hypothetical protein